MYVRHCRSGMARSGMARISVDEEKEESREAVRGESAHTSLKSQDALFAVRLVRRVCRTKLCGVLSAGRILSAAAMQIGAAPEMRPPAEFLSSRRSQTFALWFC